MAALSAFGVCKQQETTDDSSFSASSSTIEGGLSVSMEKLHSDLMLRSEDKGTSRVRASRKRKRRNDERTPVQRQLGAILVRKYLNSDIEASPVLAASADMGHLVRVGGHRRETEQCSDRRVQEKKRTEDTDEDGDSKTSSKKPRRVKRKENATDQMGSKRDVDRVGMGAAMKPAVVSRKGANKSRMDETALQEGDSRIRARKMFEWMISPVKVKKFFRELWEQKPLLVRRHQPKYYSSVFSTKELDRILREENVDFSVNIDITVYKDGQRQTLNPTGRAHAAVVWDYYQKGCSVRLLNPQTYSRSVWKLNSTLQQFFNSCVGANVYLTPAGSQGFAAHYDDIEAFVLQLEGRKHWRLYKPRSDGEVLPRYSSGNFSEDEIGSPVLDVILEPGDLLYFPRGFIHQAKTVPDFHSLHITVSTCQKNTWGDLLEKLVPAALEMAIEDDVEFRRALPRDYLDYVGITHSDKKSTKRTSFIRHVEHLMSKLFSYAPVDAAADQMVVEFLHSSLPPLLTADEAACSVHSSSPRWMSSSALSAPSQLTGGVKVRLLQHGIARLVMEEDELKLYHAVDNSRIYHGKEQQFIEITEEEAMAFEYLLQQYPHHVAVSSLPLDGDESKVEFATLLFQHGMLVMDQQLDEEFV